VKSGLLPGSASRFASKVNVNFPIIGSCGSCRTSRVWSWSRCEDGAAGDHGVITLTVLEPGHGSTRGGYGARKAIQSERPSSLRSPSQLSTRTVKCGFSPGSVWVFDLDAARAEASARANSTARAPWRRRRAWRCGKRCGHLYHLHNVGNLRSDRRLDLKGCFVAAIGRPTTPRSRRLLGLMRRARIPCDDIELVLPAAISTMRCARAPCRKTRSTAELADLAAGRKRAA